MSDVTETRYTGDRTDEFDRYRNGWHPDAPGSMWIVHSSVYLKASDQTLVTWRRV